MGISSEVGYRGLRPDSRLFMTTRARPSSWNSSIVSWRVVPKCIGPTKRSNRRSAGYTGSKLGSSHSGRRTLAARVLAADHVEMMQTILGHSTSTTQSFV